MRRTLGAKTKWSLTKAGIVFPVLLELLIALSMSGTMHAQGPALTTINDTVYRADGSPASGMALISWPSFQTADGYAVAAGTQTITIAAGGAFSAELAPNVGANPAGTYYVVVFQLDDGTVRTEYWAVPATSPTTISAVRTTPGTGLGNTAATQQYVNAAVANRAIDATVVHLAGNETITGAKQFTVPPSLPAPAQTTDATNKAYVDAAVQNVGSGQYVSISGATMTGPLVLPADPTAPNQASDRHYVDSGLEAKADLANGLVPAGELGTGVATAANCLTGNSTWSACGGGAPAGITYASTSLNWSQTMSTPITGGSQATVTLTPCPVGIDTTSGAGYQVYLSGGGNNEAVSVPASPGGCTSGAASGTISFTPYYSYASGYTIGSASSGLQETINAACGTSSMGGGYNAQCNVIVPANGPYGSSYPPPHTVNTYNIYGTLYFHTNQSVLNGSGVSLNCLGRGPCLQIGDLLSSNHYTNNAIQNLSFRSPANYSTNPAYGGVAIVNTAAAGWVNTDGGTPATWCSANPTQCYRTITTASPHGFRVGDMVTILFTDSDAYWGDAIVASVPNSTTFTYVHSGVPIPSVASPGVVALAYDAVLDNAMNTHLEDITYDQMDEGVTLFNNFFDFWDDENALIEHFNNTAVSLNRNANWTGSFVFSAGNQGQLNQIAPVITMRDSNLTANLSNGVTVYNSNGVYIENTVIQASGLWQVYAADYTGNYQGAYIKNIYSESNASLNPLTPAYSPFAGTGVAGLIAGYTSQAGSFSINGTGQVAGYFPAGTTSGGTIPFQYFIVVKDCAGGTGPTCTGGTLTQTSPMEVMTYTSTGTDAPVVRWPRVANGTDSIYYDVIRTSGIGFGPSSPPFPAPAHCTGLSQTACGSVATSITQATACGNTLVCSFTDSGAASTQPYTEKLGNYSGQVTFWPGAIVTVNKPIYDDNETFPVIGVGLSGTPAQIAKECSGYGVTGGDGAYTVCLTAQAYPSIANQAATILPDAPAVGGAQAFSKGRLNFSTSPWAAVSPHHIITLIDSDPGLTRASWGYRPPANSSDVWIGTDVAAGGVALNQGNLAFGAPQYVDFYVDNVGDGTSFLERLAANQKTFNVPVLFNSSVTLTGLSNGCLTAASGIVTSTGNPCGSGGGGGGSVTSVFGRTGAVTAASGDYSVSQVTGAAVDAAVVHNSGNETIAGTKTFTTNVTLTGALVVPQAAGYIPPVGGVGLDTAAGLPVVNIGGTTQRVALTSSNISGQAGTALALAATPTQCSGSFATGIAANGNANCTTPNVIQMSETTPPVGIPNWGVFWFDSQHHAPYFIDNNGPAVQLGLTNLFNSDPAGDPADTLEQRNGTNPQSLRVYSSYASNSVWDRISLGSETVGTTNYNVLRSEDATSGNALSLGIHIGSGIKWFFGSDGSLKPNIDGSYSIGTDTGQAMQSVFAKTSFNIYTQGRQDFEFANDTVTGTSANFLAIYNSAGTGVQTATTSSTDGVVGIVAAGAGNGAGTKSVVTWAGYVACYFDAAYPVLNDYVVASTTQAGKCHDAGVNRPTGVQVIGRVESGGVRVTLSSPSGGGGGAVSSVFGRTGAVTANAGDYSVAQVSGAAPLASPTFTGVMTNPDGTSISSSGWAGSPTFLSNVTVNGNLNVAGNINQTGSTPTQWSGKEWTGTTAIVPTGMDYSLGVGSDGTFHCQLASGASCFASGGGAVTSVFGRTGSVVAMSGDYSVGQVTGAAALASPIFTGTPTAPTASSGDNSTKLATTAYVRNETYLAWTCPVAGATTSGVSYCNWTLPAGITVTGFDLAASTAPAGCTTYPTLQVWDGTAAVEVGSYSIAMTSSGGNFYPQVTGSANVAATHALRVKVTTGGAGCSTSPAGVVAVVTYQMQN